MRIALAYSGGLDTSVIVRWLIENHGAEVVTVSGDLGQKKELNGVEAKALASGAISAHIVDLRHEFVDDYVMPALRAGALYEGVYPMATALDGFIDATQHVVNGSVTLKLYKGNITVAARWSPNSLYDTSLATYTDEDAFDHSASEGFIKIYSLPLKTYHRVNSVENLVTE